MGVNYKVVLWSKQKKKYDIIVWLGILISLVSFIGFQFALHPTTTIETAIIRATALTAFILLNVILMIGPLCRLNKKFLPLLYNRRHLGVSMFFIALIHGVFSIIQFHSLGDVNPIVSVFTSNQNYQSISDFPFQILGFFALIILFVMAATSHDFWLKNLSSEIWKGLHMMVYLAYGFVIAHVATGTLQYEDHPIYWILLFAGFTIISGLHLISAFKSLRLLKYQKKLESDGYYPIGKIYDIEEKCGKSVFINGQNIAVFKYDDKLSAVDNVCKHQMGPLSEGKIIDECITCPWHGYQYKSQDGQSPPPFKEKLKTYELKVIDENIFVNPIPKEEGSFIEPAKIR